MKSEKISLRRVPPPLPPRRSTQPRPALRRPPVSRPAALPAWPSSSETGEVTNLEPPKLHSVPIAVPVRAPVPAPVPALPPPPAAPVALPPLPSAFIPLPPPPGAHTNEFTFPQGTNVQAVIRKLKLYQLKVMAQLEHLKQLKRFNQAKLNKLIVSAYKVVGFAVLTLIVLGLVIYMGANLFYYLNSTWIEPTVVSPTDERVLQLSAKLAEQMSARDKLAAELADATRIVTMQEDYQENLKRVLQADLADRQTELKRLSALNRRYGVSRDEILRANRAYSGMSRRRIGQQFGARLIDRDTMINGNYQLSQIANGNLALAEKAIDIEKRTSSVTRDADGLATILGEQPGGQLSIEVLRIKHDYQRSQNELAKARDDKTAIKASLERYDRMVKTIANSPFIKAVDNKATIAMVPYDNLSSVTAGVPLYGCSIGLFWCRKVGHVVEVLSGEVSLKHPLHNQMVRGQTVHLQLDDPKWAQRKVLFAGGRPILF